MKKIKPRPKMYIVRHYVMATSLMDARRQSMKREPDEVNISEEWKAGTNYNLAEAIGYHHIDPIDEDEETSYT